ncbi:hypothetical protein ACIBAI_06780 [Streptomyces sp. NPDC051041]|uniref:hypothetical protein n=1 Tax=Streptomyces sp. NPDC051041 TaxID=3365640 RepID=UPI0037AE3DC5
MTLSSGDTYRTSWADCGNFVCGKGTRGDPRRGPGACKLLPLCGCPGRTPVVLGVLTWLSVVWCVSTACGATGSSLRTTAGRTSSCT